MDKIIDVSDLRTDKGMGRRNESKVVWQKERSMTEPKLLKMGGGKTKGRKHLDIGLI